MLIRNEEIKPAIPTGTYLRRVEEMFNVFPITGTIAERSTQFSRGISKGSDGQIDRCDGFGSWRYALVTRDKKIIEVEGSGMYLVGALTCLR